MKNNISKKIVLALAGLAIICGGFMSGAGVGYIHHQQEVKAAEVEAANRVKDEKEYQEEIKEEKARETQKKIAIAEEERIALEEKKEKEAEELKAKQAEEAERKQKADIQSNLETPMLPYNQLGADIDAKLIANQFNGTALIVKDDKIQLLKGYGYANEDTKTPNTPQTLYQIGSIQKALTATLIGKLVQENKINLANPLGTYVTTTDPNVANQTVSSLLNMTSGLTYPVRSIQAQGTERQIADYYTQNAHYVPYTKWKYEPEDYRILADIAMSVTNEDYNALIKKNIDDPINLHFYSVNEYLNSPLHAHAEPSALTKTQSEADWENHELSQEVGTGNIGSSVGNMYWFVRELTEGKILPNEVLSQLWQTAPDEEYAGGMYHYSDHLKFHGVVSGFECAGLTSNDCKNGVWLFGIGQSTGQNYIKFAQDIFDNQIK
jgi:CubicO group peptidase (beta-lactamase class C family)